MTIAGPPATANPRHRMFDFDKLDRLIHEKGRLAILSLLATRPAWAFADIKQQLQMTDGNLLTHLRTLEGAGYVESTREPSARGRPRTHYGITAAGRQAFGGYLNALEELLDRHRE